MQNISNIVSNIADSLYTYHQLVRGTTPKCICICAEENADTTALWNGRQVEGHERMGEKRQTRSSLTLNMWQKHLMSGIQLEVPWYRDLEVPKPLSKLWTSQTIR